METAKGRILHNGRDLTGKITISWCIERTHRGRGSWRGSFEVPSGVDVNSLLQSGCQIKLSDRRAAAISIRIAGNKIAYFRGSGLPPAYPDSQGSKASEELKNEGVIWD
jgi:hypothetical protein